MNTVFDNPLVIQVAVFAVVVTACTAFGMLRVSRERQIAVRVRLLGSRSISSADRGNGTLLSLKTKLPQITESLLLRNGEQRLRLQRRLQEAGFYQPWGMPLYVGSKCALAIALPIVCIAAVLINKRPLEYAMLAGALAALSGMYLPYLWLDRRRAKRHVSLRRAIPDFLDLVVACLSGGLSVQASLRQVADEMRLAHPGLSAELSIAIREIELGCSLDHALQQLASRTGVEELKTLRSFVHQTTRFGTTITDALGQLAEMLRIQREQRAEELAQKAAVKILFPTMLFIFPTLFVILAGPAALQINKTFVSSQHQQSSSQQQR